MDGLHCLALYMDVLMRRGYSCGIKAFELRFVLVFRSLWRFLEEIKNAVHLLVIVIVSWMQGS